MLTVINPWYHISVLYYWCLVLILVSDLVLLLLLIVVAAKQPLETKALPLKDACAPGIVDSSKNKKSVSKLYEFLYFSIHIGNIII